MSMWRPLFLKCMILDQKLQRMLNDSKIAQLNSERPLHQTAVSAHLVGWAEWKLPLGFSLSCQMLKAYLMVVDIFSDEKLLMKCFHFQRDFLDIELDAYSVQWLSKWPFHPSEMHIQCWKLVFARIPQIPTSSKKNVESMMTTTQQTFLLYIIIIVRCISKDRNG